MRDFRKLLIWQKGHNFTLSIYKATKEFPVEERFGLTSQIRRSAASIPSNIAEGCGRNSKNELAQFLQIAIGSAMETSYQLILSRDLDYITENQYVTLQTELSDVIHMMISYNDKIKNNKNN